MTYASRRKRGSSKPCPGCAQVKEWRPAAEVCGDCKITLARATWLEEQLALSASDVLVVYGKHSHGNQYLRSQAHMPGGRESAGRVLMEHFQKLARAASRPAPKTSDLQDGTHIEILGKPNSGGYAVSVEGVMPESLATAIRDLRQAVEEALAAEYAQGKRDGHNLLLRLAEGDISATDFNAKTQDEEAKP